MICKDCPKLSKIANTEESRMGICMRSSNWLDVCIDNECLFTPKPHTCSDCWHFVTHDSACMTAEANDEICCGFEDKRYYDMVEILFDWINRGYSCDELYNKALNEAKLI